MLHLWSTLWNREGGFAFNNRNKCQELSSGLLHPVDCKIMPLNNSGKPFAIRQHYQKTKKTKQKSSGLIGFHRMWKIWRSKAGSAFQETVTLVEVSQHGRGLRQTYFFLFLPAEVFFLSRSTIWSHKTAPSKVWGQNWKASELHHVARFFLHETAPRDPVRSKQEVYTAMFLRSVCAIEWCFTLTQPPQLCHDRFCWSVFLSNSYPEEKNSSDAHVWTEYCRLAFFIHV